MSIRLRLTVWYTAVLAAVLVLFGVALYSLLTFSLLNEIDRQLEATANRVAQVVRLRLSAFSLSTELEIPELDSFATPGLYIQVYDTNSGQFFRSGTLGEGALPLGDDTLVQVQAQQAEFRTVKIGETKVRIYSVPLVIRDQVIGVAQVGAPLNQLEQTQRQLVSLLVAAGVIAVVVSAVLGALLSRAALRPIDQITQTALAISRAEDLSRRLEAKGPADEVGRLAATFNEMLARLEALFHTQQRFIADVSHELRTPLTTIQGNVELLHRGAADDPQARLETLAAIEGELGRMSRLVADLLLLARVDAGIRLEMQTVELDTLLLDVYRQARVMSNGVEVRLGHEDQAMVLGDADRLRQLLLNLVDNALKYTHPGGQVTLSLYRDEAWVRLEVTDTGVGIPPEDLQAGPRGLPLIFERFYRADPTRSRPQGGTGLGLSIAHWIAQAHGGEITVESQVGQGSTFTVKLPIHP